MARSRLQTAKQDILKFFETETSQTLKYREIASLLASQRSFWRLAQRTNTDEFIRFLTKSGKLKKINFPFPHRKETRYTWGDAPLLSVLLTLGQKSYFSHYTAMRMHGLTEQIPKTIYLNHEQRPKEIYVDHEQQYQDAIENKLAQSDIDKAFSNKARVTTNIIKYGNIKICMVSSKFTNLLGVVSEEVLYDDVETKVRVTNIERTLIDIAVRPMYSGGIYEVQKAYVNARENASVNNLSAMLKKICYLYPYHQTIGYYLKKANYPARDLDIIKKIPIDRDFYLTNQMKEMKYIEEWRLYVPRGF